MKDLDELIENKEYDEGLINIIKKMLIITESIRPSADVLEIALNEL